MTMRVRAARTFSAPPEQVFAFFDDLANAAELQPRLVEITDVETLANGGKRIAYVTRGRDDARHEGKSEHLEYDPPHLVVIASDADGVTTTATRRFEPVRGGTRVVAELEYAVHAPVLSRLIELQWRRRARGELRRMLAAAERRLDAEPPPT